jgi:para-nitrobenzyl esterase
MRILKYVVAGLLLVAALFWAVGRSIRPVRPWSASSADPETLRTTKQGPIIGGESRAKGHVWLGVPFAAPPVGPLRFRAPSPPASWSDTRKALTPPQRCTQIRPAYLGGKEKDVQGSEDCLYLNIYAPRFSPSTIPQAGQRRPVMFFIHGGGNSIGYASQLDGGFLAVRQDVIVVMTQYRLGPLGWFRHRALREESAGAGNPLEQSGNFGTLDQIEALKWVRENIAAFGGDPDNITIFGESAGGVNVYALLLAPAARGLFHRAIVQSGFLPRATTAEAENFSDDPQPGHFHSSSEILAKLLVSEGKAADAAAARKMLATMSGAEIAGFVRGLSASSILHAYSDRQFGGMLSMPAVIRDGALLPTAEPLDRLAAADGWNRVPVILGSNLDEFKLFQVMSPHFVQRQGFSMHILDEPYYEATAEYPSRGWKAVGVDEPAAAMRRSGATAVYAYRFDWRGEPKLAGNDFSKLFGAAHAFELPFVFGHFELNWVLSRMTGGAEGPGRTQLSKQMMAYWGEFARRGAPGKGGAAELAEWTAWDDSAPASAKYMILGAAADGSLKMGSAVETRAALAAAVDADPRLATQLAKCRVYSQMAMFHFGLAKEDYPRAGQAGCAAFPLDKFPWDGGAVSK